ncbi:MAG: hypothetical protein CFE24_08620 [Flavobacterium sp. BFFFF2]|nr:MAG: hypothetical protein CFE24_08620 [Flavobacterium sp. BFFFF2]
MKKLYTFAFLILSSAIFAQASDSFLYTGAVTANGWGTVSGTAGQIVTSAGSLTYPGVTSAGNKTSIVAGNSEDISLTSALALTGDAYYSALINLPNTTGLAANTTNGAYSLMFGTLSTTAQPTYVTFPGRLYIKSGALANTFSLGILNGAGGTAAPTFSAANYNINTTYMVVVKFNFTTNTASLFVNPTLGATEGTATVTNATGTAAAPAQINGFIIRQAGTGTAGTGNVEIDEIKMGNTWASVMPVVPSTSTVPLPTASSQSFCNAATAAELVATGIAGATISWFDVATGGTALTAATALASGTYFVSQTTAESTVTVATGFAAPFGVAVQADSKILVADTNNNAIMRMNADGTGSVALGSGFLHPLGVAVQADGKILVADTNNNEIKRMDADGTSIVTLGSGFNLPTSIAVQADGKIVVADYNNNAIKRMDADGTNIVAVGSGFTMPSGVTIEADGKILVSDSSNNISRMNADGSGIVTVGSGFNNPAGVAVQADGKIIVADYNNNAIKRMNADGSSIETVGTGLSAPYGIALQSDGSLLVADSGNNAIKKITLVNTSDRLSVPVSVITTPAPTAAAQTFCGSRTVANLVATGTALKWYADNTTTTALSSTDAIATGTYYVSQTTNNCESIRTMVDVTVNITPPPTASAQTFCSGKTVADLVGTGTVLRWYTALTGGAALPAATALTTATYYVSQSVNACRSTRTAVSITVIAPTAAPTAIAQTFCGSKTVADLVATGTDILWYATNTSTTALASTDAIATGTYYVTQTLNACESTRTAVLITVDVTAPPTATAQTLCGTKTVADLVATGTALNWYADNTTTTALLTTDVVATGTYYVSQTLNTCESVRTSVAVTVNFTAAPTAAAQTFCGSKTIADLVASGSALRWYASDTSTIILVATDAITTGTYYVSQSQNSCRSTRTPVSVTVNITAAPTAAAQNFCGSKTVADLVATGTTLKWYTTNTITIPMTSTAVIASGTYYVSQTLNGCESTRTAVAVTVNTTAAPAAAAQILCGTKTVADLVANGNGLKWYADNTTATALASTAAIVTSTYFVSQTVNTCESTRTSVAVTVNTTPAPSAEAQTFCGSKTVADLVATGSALKWYADNTTTTALASTTALATGTYFVSQTLNACESSRASIAVTLTNTNAPIATAQTYCGSRTVADLSAVGANLHWYADNTTSTALASTAAVTTGTYFVSQTLNACESTRASVAVTVNITAAPTGNATQDIPVAILTDATLAQLVVSPSNVTWYANLTDALAGIMALTNTTVLTSGSTYYAVNNANGCPSTPFAVTVTVTLGAEAFDAVSFNYHPNPTAGILNLSCSNVISEVCVINVLGQEMRNLKTNANELQIDLTLLPAATYFVKVVSAGTSQTVKVVKGN